MTRRDTFMHIKTWLEDVLQHGNDQVKAILVANKSDVAGKRQVSAQEGKDFAELHGMLYVETSARSGENVEEAFHSLAAHIFHSLNLSRDVSQFSDADIRNLELNGVKVGPRRGLILTGSDTNNDSNCC